MADNQTDRVEELGFDRILQDLRTVVAALENGNLGLEESLRRYEEGVRLARRGHALLDNAEKRVEILVREGRDGHVTEPFEPPAGPSGESDRDET